MTIPKPSEMKQTILDYLVKAKRPVKLSDLAEEVARHFKVTEEEQAERNPSGGKKFSNLVGSVVTALGKNGELRSTGHGFWEVSTTPPPPPPATSTNPDKFIQRTAEIVAAYVINNPVQPEQIPGIIEDTYATLLGLRGQTAEGQTMSQQPAVPIEKSVSPDHITCLECGRKFKSLKGHINQLHGRMTPDEYRKKWGLLPDYPMVSELYAAERSKIAKQVRLEKNVRQET